MTSAPENGPEHSRSIDEPVALIVNGGWATGPVDSQTVLAEPEVVWIGVAEAETTKQANKIEIFV
jgi:hypothetical protein